MKSILKLVLTLSILATLGCLDDRSVDDPLTKELKKALETPYDKLLRKISPGAASLQHERKLSRAFTCSFSKVLPNIMVEVDNETSPTQGSQRYSLGFQEKCDFYVAIDTETSPVFEEIKSTGVLPKALYSFTAISHPAEGEDRYVEKEIGLFRAMDTCRKFEQMAQALEMPTKNCKPWQD